MMLDDLRDALGALVCRVFWHRWMPYTEKLYHLRYCPRCERLEVLLPRGWEKA